MRCDEWKNRLASYLSRELGEAERRDTDEHLASCARCRAEVDAFAELWRELGRLPAPSVPSEKLRERLADTLAAERVTAKPGPWRASLLAAALAGMAFLAGFLTRGAPIPRAGAPEGPRWVLLLYDRSASEQESAEEARRVVEEYSAWARRLARQGKLIGGEKLVDAVSLLTPVGSRTPPESAPRIGGYFVIVAKDAEEANSIARSCPHLARGGEVELRAIDPV